LKRSLIFIVSSSSIVFALIIGANTNYISTKKVLKTVTPTVSVTSTFVAPVGWTCHEDNALKYCYQIK